MSSFLSTVDTVARQRQNLRNVEKDGGKSRAVALALKGHNF